MCSPETSDIIHTNQARLDQEHTLVPVSSQHYSCAVTFAAGSRNKGWDIQDVSVGVTPHSLRSDISPVSFECRAFL